MLKFTPMRLVVTVPKNTQTQQLIETPSVDNFTTFEEKIKSIFGGWFRKTEWDDILINPKKYWWKYLVIKENENIEDESTQNTIWKQHDIDSWKLFVMCLQVAEENTIREYKEVVENGKVQFRISDTQQIFEDYYVGIYFNATSVDETNSTIFVWNIFSVHKGKYNINESLKWLLNDVYPDCGISMDYETTKKRVQQFQEDIKKVIIRTQVKPSTINPNLGSSSDDYMVDVKLELTAKKQKQTLWDRTQNVINEFRNFRKDVLNKAVDWTPFEMENKEIKAKIWKQEVGVEYNEDNTIMCVLKDWKEMRDVDYTNNGFTQECKNYFNNWVETNATDT